MADSASFPEGFHGDRRRETGRHAPSRPNLSNAPRTAQGQPNAADPKPKRGTPFPVAQPSWLRKSADARSGQKVIGASLQTSNTQRKIFPTKTAMLAVVPREIVNSL
jgi:hypothetical protein